MTILVWVVFAVFLALSGATLWAILTLFRRPASDPQGITWRMRLVAAWEGGVALLLGVVEGWKALPSIGALVATAAMLLAVPWLLEHRDR